MSHFADKHLKCWCDFLNSFFENRNENLVWTQGECQAGIGASRWTCSDPALTVLLLSNPSQLLPYRKPRHTLDSESQQITGCQIRERSGF